MDVENKKIFWEEDLALYPSLQEYWETLHIKREAGFCIFLQVMFLTTRYPWAVAQRQCFMLVATTGRNILDSKFISATSPDLKVHFTVRMLLYCIWIPRQST